MAHGIQLLQRDASVAETAIEHTITRALAQCEHDALTSFAYNCGGGALAGSVGRAVNAKQDPTSALEQYVHAGSRVLEGLVTRRKSEAALFTSGEYADGDPPLPPGLRRCGAEVRAVADGGAEAGPGLGVELGRVEARRAKWTRPGRRA